MKNSFCKKIKMESLLIIFLFVFLFGWAYFQSYETPYQEESFALRNFQKVDQDEIEFYPNVKPICNSTIVSAYYNISSKHSPAEYFEWITNFLSLVDCMVVFTTPDNANIFRKLRDPSRPLEILIQPFENFYVYKEYDQKIWDFQATIDREKHVGHNKKVYWVWNEKTNFLKLASQWNIFKSNYFVWVDIGCIRHNRFNNMQLINHLPSNPGVLFLKVLNFTENDLIFENGVSNVDFGQVDRIGAGVFGGSADQILKWHKAYYSTLQRYINENRFAGKEQNIMATTCIENDVCLILDGTDYRWFLLHDYYLGLLKIEPVLMNLTEFKLKSMDIGFTENPPRDE
ncbi:uncharacterized protein LOC111709295 [Eurytemora carolleeae]|uniref:uncharacterized protein LOC111709295 n=1 Tax=Eurytemora carolleeae TaxID=1294199 RepID=UPI000C770E92|nr:uncharacterized protein LOC111709295 [Eurytemora carolleeae]|eukprot:XP_023338693.1 uncharacterized protein LOC111709295 [Eurytemora affinis]